MMGAMGENQYFSVKEEQRAAMKETAQEDYINRIQGDLVRPKREPPQPPKRPPQDIDAYFNNLLKELGEIYLKQFNREPPPGYFPKIGDL